MIFDDETRRALGAGALTGGLAWLVGYLLTYAAAIGDVRSNEQFRLLESAADESLTVEMIGLLFYNAHNVSADVPQYGLLRALESNHDFIAADGGSTLLLYGVPVVVLVVGGAVVTRAVRYDLESTADAAFTGTTVVVGYLPFAVLGSIGFAIDLGEGAMRPDLLLSIGFAGTFYPLLFGAIGGVGARFATRGFREGSLSDSDGT
ncbi:hypothetical protein [Natrinema salaciae]|uniref:DUF7978 domain-containing protein n=1 Tax=Natrinema salaciae TaxID=1186196 RepID=A0A1H9MYB1_9EURY|nr:hypothetical protein [Natrinema salaciae]SER28527.1 hypothetical protein SAMN04489841_3547 [Natrinema salaciae]